MGVQKRKDIHEFFKGFLILLLIFFLLLGGACIMDFDTYGKAFIGLLVIIFIFLVGYGATSDELSMDDVKSSRFPPLIKIEKPKVPIKPKEEEISFNYKPKER